MIKQGADVNAQANGYNPGTPLNYAANNGHLGIVEYLIIHGADFSEGFNEESYLHWASKKGHLSIVVCLVNRKADVNEKDKNDDIFLFIGLLFILLLIKVILMLLNILLMKELI